MELWKVSEKQKCKYCPRSYVDLDGHIERQHADKIQDEATGGGNNKSCRPNEKAKQSCPPRKNGNKKGSQEIGNSQNPSTDPIVDHWNVERRSLNLSESSTDSEDSDDQNNVSTDDRVLASRTSNVNDSMLEQFNDMRLNQPLDDKIESPETNPQQRPRLSKKSSIGLSDALKALDDSSTTLNEEKDDDENRTIVVCESSLGSADITDDNSISTDDPFLASNDIVNDSTSKVNYVNDALAQLNGLDISESFIDNNVPPGNLTFDA
uniref:C2H2-type domain-containing protein n=1 Tax=Panagrolaimus davidi TaxID=227884 RepID=A0A914PTL0_9BILA